MAFPPLAYTTRGGVSTVTTASGAEWLLQPDEPEGPDPAASDVAAQVQLEDDDADTAAIEEERLAA